MSKITKPKRKEEKPMLNSDGFIVIGLIIVVIIATIVVTAYTIYTMTKIQKDEKHKYKCPFCRNTDAHAVVIDGPDGSANRVKIVCNCCGTCTGCYDSEEQAWRIWGRRN